MVLNACFRFLNQSFILHLHDNIWTVSVFRFKKVKKKYQKSPSKSHSWSCPWWVFQTRHQSFVLQKRFPCFFSPKIMNYIFWSKRGSCLTYFNKIFLRYRSNFQVLPKLSDRGGRQKILLKSCLIWDEKNSMWGQGFFYWLEIAGSRIFWPYYLFVISYPIIMIIFWTHL